MTLSSAVEWRFRLTEKYLAKPPTSDENSREETFVENDLKRRLNDLESHYALTKRSTSTTQNKLSENVWHSQI